MSSLFDSNFKRWVESACMEWNYPEPTEEYYEYFYNRIPHGLRVLLSDGIENGLILPDGHRFRIKGLDENKGPYNWFSNYSNANAPGVNWEYFVHVALYSQLYHQSIEKGIMIKFEDKLMDITLRDKERLLVCIEVKEKAENLKKLIYGMRKYQNDVDLYMKDKGNDPLR